MNVDQDTTFINLQHLIGITSFAKRSQASVTIVGVGGIGSWIAEFLVRSGLIHITLIDLDDICISNTNRQLHTMRSTLGKSKVLTLKARMEDINPLVKITAIEDFLTKENMSALINPHSFIIDAIDSLSVKCELVAYCISQGIKLVVTGGAAGKRNPQLVKVQDLSQTFNDPLLQRVRKKLRLDYEFPKKKKISLGIRTIFSPEEMIRNINQASCDSELVSTNCNNGLGTCVTVLTTFAVLATNEVLSLIEQH